MKNLERLEKFQLFQGLDAEAIARITSSATKRSIEAGKILLRQGDAPETLFVVTEGRIRMITLNGDGAQRVLREMKVGDLIGCAAVFRRVPYPATAVAQIDSAVLAWSSADFLRLTTGIPQLGTNALAISGQRTLEMLDRFRTSASASVVEKVALALLHAAQQESETGATKPLVVSISRQELSELSGTTLFTVSRLIAKWSRAGIVAGGRLRITVLDLHKLKALTS